MSLVSRSVTTLVLAAAISAGVALLPVPPFGAHPAWPHGGGGGGGGGNGGGNGNGNGGGHGNSGGAALGAGSSVGSGTSASAASSVDLGHIGRSSGSKASKGSTASRGLKGSAASKSTKGSTASQLGALNAAHASPNALAHASPSSRVGKIAAYKDSVAALNTANTNLAAAQAAFAANPNATTQAALTAAQSAQATAQANTAQALATAANKSISTSSVVGVNNLLGVSLTAPTTSADLASQAAALQTKP
jgi:hypothetical protein